MKFCANPSAENSVQIDGIDLWKQWSTIWNPPPSHRERMQSAHTPRLEADVRNYEGPMYDNRQDEGQHLAQANLRLGIPLVKRFITERTGQHALIHLTACISRP
jgi:hypothetical protein